MTDEPKKKTPGRAIGGISQWGSFGGDEENDVQTPSSLDVQTPKRSSVQTPSSLDVQTPKRSSVQTPSSLDVQTPKRSSVQTPSSLDVQTPKQQRIRQTVYLEPEVDKWIRHHIADTREEISNIVNEAIKQYRATLEG